ncbi:thermonuclease family protein [uncultured Desulfobulbus sp.]|uniref:thermonuclease family protein n=1 Tax=uncultured Desulfobulbus sp. TaxID=239745 RepID=UPI0029C7FA11|nr:thermonuclease family protein [uncultured Desulfobulbus sp.]
MYRSTTAHIHLITLLILISIPSICLAWPAQVVSVSDGDTITVLRQGQQVKIRLYGIDTPENGQAFGQKAKEVTSTLIAGRHIDIEKKDTDRYGRIVGLVQVDGQNLNELIIQNGYAWVYLQYCKEQFCSQWKQSEAEARHSKRGLWADPDAIPPWEWRHLEQASQRSSIAGNDPRQIPIREGRPIGDRASGGQNGCDGRTYCSQMTSCQEATFFLKNCPGTKMDGNRDGVPCERQWCR